MVVISILEADEFDEDLYSIMRENLTGLIKERGARIVTAAGDTKGMIYRLLSELAVEYPYVFFTILLSNDKPAYEGGGTEWPNIFRLDCNIAYDDPKSAKQRRREKLIEDSDIVFCLQKYTNGIRAINKHCDILALKTRNALD